MSRNFISTNEELHRGDSLVSNNGNYKAVFEHNGNFVVYEWSPVWTSHTSVPDEGAQRLVLQEDTNLVLYTPQFNPVWASGNYNSQGSQRMRLTMTDEGKLEVTRDGKLIWSNGVKYDD